MLDPGHGTGVCKWPSPTPDLTHDDTHRPNQDRDICQASQPQARNPSISVHESTNSELHPGPRNYPGRGTMHPSARHVERPSPDEQPAPVESPSQYSFYFYFFIFSPYEWDPSLWGLRFPTRGAEHGGYLVLRSRGASDPGGTRWITDPVAPHAKQRSRQKRYDAPQPTLQHPPNRRALCNRGPPGDLLGWGTWCPPPRGRSSFLFTGECQVDSTGGPIYREGDRRCFCKASLVNLSKGDRRRRTMAKGSGGGAGGGDGEGEGEAAPCRGRLGDRGWGVGRPASAPTLLWVLATGDACALRVGARLDGGRWSWWWGIKINIVRE